MQEISNEGESECDQDHQIVIYKAPQYDNPDYTAFLLLQYILGASSDYDTVAWKADTIKGLIKSYGIPGYLILGDGSWKFAYIPYVSSGVFAGKIFNKQNQDIVRQKMKAIKT